MEQYKNYIRTLLLVLGLTFVFPLSSQAGWGIHDVTVEKVGVQGNYFVIWMNDASGANSFAGRKKFFKDSVKKELLAVALSALASGKKCQGSFNSDVDGGELSQLFIVE